MHSMVVRQVPLRLEHLSILIRVCGIAKDVTAAGIGRCGGCRLGIAATKNLVFIKLCCASLALLRCLVVARNPGRDLSIRLHFKIARSVRQNSVDCFGWSIEISVVPLRSKLAGPRCLNFACWQWLIELEMIEFVRICLDRWTCGLRG